MIILFIVVSVLQIPTFYYSVGRGNNFRPLHRINSWESAWNNRIFISKPNNDKGCCQVSILLQNTVSNHRKLNVVWLSEREDLWSDKLQEKEERTGRETVTPKIAKGFGKEYTTSFHGESISRRKDLCVIP